MDDKKHKFPFRDDGTMMSAEEIAEVMNRTPLREDPKRNPVPKPVGCSREEFEAMGNITMEEAKKKYGW